MDGAKVSKRPNAFGSVARMKCPNCGAKMKIRLASTGFGKMSESLSFNGIIGQINGLSAQRRSYPCLNDLKSNE